MGQGLDRARFAPGDRRAFIDRLEASLAALQQLLVRPGFGVGAASIGAELELYLVDRQGSPALLNQQLVAELGDPRLTLELNRYNLEFNASPQALAGTPFRALGVELDTALARLRAAAARHGGRVGAIGILPTLTEADFGPRVMTDEPRYHALTRSLLRLRHGQPFDIHIDGPEPVELQADHVTYEGANTSFQCHWRVSPEHFCDSFNALQLATPLVLALSANSPLFLGRRLWAETRIALFRQSIDSRDPARHGWQLPARVSYGQGWMRGGPWEWFAEAVRLYPPLLPACSDEDPLQALAEGRMPRLDELRLHAGTVWHWNRPVYDAAGGGHLRIEMRALPAGPSTPDMLASCAWLIGLAEGLRPRIAALLPALPFKLALHNLYTAARDGLDAALVWPVGQRPSPRERPVLRLVRELRPVVEEGLERLGVEATEREDCLALMDERAEAAMNGARWQVQALASLERRMGRPEALRCLLEHYLDAQAGGQPVARWGVPR